MENFNRGTNFTTFSTTTTTAKDKSLLVSTFAWMFLALVISAVASFAFAAVPSLSDLLFVKSPFDESKIIGVKTLWYVFAFSPIVIVLVMNFGFNKLSYFALVALFLGYSLLMGISLSTIFLKYKMATIGYVFLSTAGIFGLMALLGATTKTDLSKMGTIMMFALLGVIVMSLVNYFIQSSGLDFILSIVCVVIFTGLAAYHTQNLKNMSEYNDGSVQMKKLGILSALKLYVTFINLFLTLLRLFGNGD